MLERGPLQIGIERHQEQQQETLYTSLEERGALSGAITTSELHAGAMRL